MQKAQWLFPSVDPRHFRSFCVGINVRFCLQILSKITFIYLNPLTFLPGRVSYLVYADKGSVFSGSPKFNVLALRLDFSS